MNILILGGGGREHALAWKIAQSPLCEQLYCAPGNAGIAAEATCVELDILDGPAIADWCAQAAIGLVVVGPEAPLAAGVSDVLRDRGLRVFGPTKAAAELETSKAFTKRICDAAGVPTADWERFDSADAAHSYISERSTPIVIKADGLAAGKGVVVAESDAEAREAIDMMFSGGLGEAGSEVIIEDFLAGEEASYFVLTDGTSVLPLAGAQDHKRAYDGDKGPNTGGMGAYSPTPVLDPDMEARVLDQIIRPTIAEMRRRGTPYSGVLYAGLMIGPDGPKLIEYNARFGDPECQVLMRRLSSDIVPALLSCAQGDLAGVTLAWEIAPALTVVMASEGYPESYEKGQRISLPEAPEGVTIFHAGTRQEAGHLVSNGGRVLNVTATGRDLAEARARTYATVDAIDWPGGFCRRDIAWRVLS